MNRVTDFKEISNAIIHHARFVELHNRIIELMELTADLGEPQCLGIEGPKGVGKTTLDTKIKAKIRGICQRR
jgi:pantothenate kinase-related protein Tda10